MAWCFGRQASGIQASGRPSPANGCSWDGVCRHEARIVDVACDVCLVREWGRSELHPIEGTSSENPPTSRPRSSTHLEEKSEASQSRQELCLVSKMIVRDRLGLKLS